MSASSVFFVLGNPSQSANKYSWAAVDSDSTDGSSMRGGVLAALPASWDSLLVGMGCNEVRVIGMPPCYYRSKALSGDLGLQTDSYLQVTVKCLSINGEA